MKKKEIISPTIAIGIALLFSFFLTQSHLGVFEKRDIRVIVVDNESNSGIKTLTNLKPLPKRAIIHEFKSIDGYSAKLTKKEFEELKKDSSKKVYLVKKYHAILDESIPQIHVNDSWMLKVNGTNLTGKGEAVCILDTGVNYTHPALGGCYGNNNASSSCKVVGGYDFINDDSDPMDDHGHGTHVAGIVASNDTTYRGVAPDSKIVAMKVLDSGGSGNSDDIIAAIDWCIGNASKFNISVISMSLGDCSNHSTYCNSDPMAPAINNAVAHNITVVVAAGNGNGGGCTGITITAGPASPACVESASAIGGVDGSDNIYYQRGPLFELMAPGLGITSTSINGGFVSESGTSMATPHVAGAVLLMQELSHLQENKDKRVSEIKSALNNTGKVLDDSAGSGYNFTRINVYNALLSIEKIPPIVNLISPINGKVSMQKNQSFSCNFTDWQLKNVTFYLWNSTGLFFNSTQNISGKKNQSLFNVSGMDLGEYFWNCGAYDEQNNYAFSSANYTIKIGEIQTTLLSPVNGTYTNINETNFSCRIVSDSSHELSNVTFYLWNSTSLIYNSTTIISGFDQTEVFNYTFLSEESYYWNCLGFDNSSNSSWGNSNYSVEYDATSPNITNIGESVTSSSATITWTTDEPANSSVNGTGFAQNSSDFVTSHSIVINGLSASTTYYYNITSCDMASNCANITNQSFTTSSSSSGGGGGSGGSGGGGGGGSSLRYFPTQKELEGGYTRELNLGDQILFKLHNQSNTHILTPGLIADNYTRIIIESTRIDLKIYIGEEKKINLTNADYYDLYIKLNSITNKTNASITIKQINEAISPKNQTKNKYHIMNNSIENPQKNQEKRKFPWIIFQIIGIIISIVVLIIFWRKWRKE